VDGHHLPIRGKFDLIILSDLLNDVWDVHAILVEVARVSNPSTRIVLNVYSRLGKCRFILRNYCTSRNR
jgi:hypothetical protein